MEACFRHGLKTSKDNSNFLISQFRHFFLQFWNYFSQFSELRDINLRLWEKKVWIVRYKFVNWGQCFIFIYLFHKNRIEIVFLTHGVVKTWAFKFKSYNYAFVSATKY